MPRENPIPHDLKDWPVERMMLDRRWRAIFRRRGITVIVVQRDDGRWNIDKLKGGVVLAQSDLKNLPRPVRDLVTGVRRQNGRAKQDQAGRSRPGGRERQPLCR